MQAEQGHLLVETAGGGKGGAHMQLPKFAIEIGTPSAHTAIGEEHVLECLTKDSIASMLMRISCVKDTRSCGPTPSRALA